MIKRLFSPRNICIFISALTVMFASYACGAAPASTDAPAATEEPAATEAPVATEPPAMLTFIAPPATNTGVPVIIDFTSTPAGTQAPSGTPYPVIPESRRLTLEYPPKMKAGVEGDIIRLTLEVDDLGNITPTAIIGGNIVSGEVIEIPNLYETHLVTAEARIDMAGMEIQPSGSTYEPMKPGQSVTFHWSVRPQETGVYRGIVWLHLVFVDRVSAEESRMAVSAQVVEIEAVDFFGFSVDFVRTSGVVGSVLSIIVGFPFLEDILRFLFKKRRRKTRRK